ncbi:hypothetical protein LB521_04460 [Mesorhizobium sp. BR-1-1-8]|nr:hypothetical protein [Mesorhizobium sp. BR-1-1-8]MBZ9980399.1 hypothetical protein [Mesorhizobium sp. BR-1-1-8]
MAAVELLTVRGDKSAAVEALKLKDFKACSDAFALALSHHFDADPKNE